MSGLGVSQKFTFHLALDREGRYSSRKKETNKQTYLDTSLWTIPAFGPIVIELLGVECLGPRSSRVVVVPLGKSAAMRRTADPGKVVTMSHLPSLTQSS